MQFVFIHKEVQNPQLLCCPADRQRKVALSWGAEERGLAAPGMQNDCISYCIGLDAGLNSGGGALDLADAKNQILLSERHMEYDAVTSACSANVGLTKAIKVNRQNGTNALAPLGWKEKNPKLHSRGGSVAMLDGSAHQLYGGQLQELIQEPSDNGELHFIYP